MTKGYVVALVEVTNPTGYEAYRNQVLATIEAHGGRFLVRGGEAKLLEGAETPGRIVVLEFDSPARAMEWYHSPAYQAILPLRLDNSSGWVACLPGND